MAYKTLKARFEIDNTPFVAFKSIQFSWTYLCTLQCGFLGIIFEKIKEGGSKENEGLTTFDIVFP